MGVHVHKSNTTTSTRNVESVTILWYLITNIKSLLRGAVVFITTVSYNSGDKPKPTSVMIWLNITDLLQNPHFERL